MIAVVGRLDEGAAVAVAQAAAARSATAELIATVPPGAAGDASLLELAAAGIGHAAALRSPAASLDPGDLQLALRYLPDVRVIVVADDAATLGPTAVEAASWSSAALILVTAVAEATDLAAPGAIILAAPSGDPDGAFAGVVAALAVRLDAGEAAAAAWRAVTTELGLDEVMPASVEVRPASSSVPDPPRG